jgi:hypothetical protein
MSAVMDTPDIGAHEAYALQEEPPLAPTAHPGVWHAVMAYMRRQSVHRLQRTSSSSHVSLHPIEMPLERLAQEHPMLYFLGFFGMHHG